MPDMNFSDTEIQFKTDEIRATLLELAQTDSGLLGAMREYLDADLIVQYSFQPSPMISAAFIRARDLDVLGEKGCAHLFTNFIEQTSPEQQKSFRTALNALACEQNGQQRQYQHGPWRQEYEATMRENLPKVTASAGLSF
ncbi:MAG: hypothetical protein K2Q12_04125 [Rickettsiales bacterium]|nr:hypothetical protein [Rickettsiales bacterium]